MEIQDAGSQLDREIEILDQRIAARNAKITELEGENEVDKGRQQTLTETKAAISVVLAKLQEIGPLLGGEPLALPAVAAKKSKRNPHLKKYVLPILDQSGMGGMMEEEIIAALKDKHSIEVAVTTLRPFLRKLKQAGTIEQTAERRWRETARGSDAGEVRHSAAAD